jgi:uncharacterized protein (TIGR02246 family)
MRYPLAAALTVTFVASVLSSPSADEALIRAARARSNAAIAAHDLDGIARVWMPDVHVVSSTSAQGAGRDENRARMAAQFERRPDTVYERRPIEVRVYAPWQVASERGEWWGTWTESDGKVRIGGAYLAQWRKVGREWLIQAEVFVPAQCTGSDRYCASRPD